MRQALTFAVASAGGAVGGVVAFFIVTEITDIPVWWVQPLVTGIAIIVGAFVACLFAPLMTAGLQQENLRVAELLKRRITARDFVWVGLHSVKLRRMNIQLYSDEKLLQDAVNQVHSLSDILDHNENYLSSNIKKHGDVFVSNLNEVWAKCSAYKRLDDPAAVEKVLAEVREFHDLKYPDLEKNLSDAIRRDSQLDLGPALEAKNKKSEAQRT